MSAPITDESNIPEQATLPEPRRDFPKWEDAGDSLMSNCDHEVNEAIAEKLRSGQFIADYAGWNFHATCWFEHGQFHAAVRCYHSLRGVYSADTPAELMEVVSNEYGQD